jgi:hypothetical protein
LQFLNSREQVQLPYSQLLATTSFYSNRIIKGNLQHSYKAHTKPLSIAAWFSIKASLQ